MPRGDRTGPNGMGPMTGRGAGFCAGFAMPGYANPAFGRGFAMGRGAWGRGRFAGGGGRGWRNGYYATGMPGWARFGAAAPYAYPDSESEKQSLRAQADAMQSEMEAIRKRLEELEKEEGGK